MQRQPIFDAVRTMLGRGFTAAEVSALDNAIDRAAGSAPATLPPTPTPSPSPVAKPSGRALGGGGAALIKKWEGCGRRRADGKFDAYPDPGSIDGKPWTIGWGSTGADIRKGVVWTQAECDARFAVDIQTYVDAVGKALGTAPTTENQFDALVSFHYNTGAIAKATLTKLHKQGQFAAAAKEFAKWIYNDGKPMKGLANRRAEEVKLYGKS